VIYKIDGFDKIKRGTQHHHYARAAVYIRGTEKDWSSKTKGCMHMCMRTYLIVYLYEYIFWINIYLTNYFVYLLFFIYGIL
jgi:hypothetical protein